MCSDSSNDMWRDGGTFVPTSRQNYFVSTNGSRQSRYISASATLLAQKPDDTIEIDLDLDELDATSAETKATYQEIKDYVLKEFGLKVSNLYISQIKKEMWNRSRREL